MPVQKDDNLRGEEVTAADDRRNQKEKLLTKVVVKEYSTNLVHFLFLDYTDGISPLGGCVIPEGRYACEPVLGFLLFCCFEMLDDGKEAGELLSWKAPCQVG